MMKIVAWTLALAPALTGCARLIDLGPNDLGPNDLGANDLGANDLGASDLGPNDLGPSVPCLAAAGFGDDFEDGRLGDAWEPLFEGDSQPVEGAGALSLRPDPTRASRSQIASRLAFDLSSSEVVVEVLEVLSASPLGWTQLQLVGPSDGRVRFYVQDGQLGASYKPIGQPFVELAATAHDPAAHRFWRVREREGLVEWAHGPDGASWTDFAEVDVGFAVDAVQIQLEAGTSAAAGDLGRARFGGINGQAARRDGSVPPCAADTEGDAG